MAEAQTVGEGGGGEAGAGWGWGGVVAKGLWPTLLQPQVFLLSGMRCAQGWGLLGSVKIQVKTL